MAADADDGDAGHATRTHMAATPLMRTRGESEVGLTPWAWTPVDLGSATLT